MKLIVKIYVVMSMVTFGCASKKNMDKPFEVSYIKSKGRSANTPYYKVEIKDNVLNYNGFANMSLLDKHTFNISSNDLKLLKVAFKNSRFKQFKNTYIGQIRDVPLTYFTYNAYTISYHDLHAPNDLKKLASLIEELLLDNAIKAIN